MTRAARYGNRYGGTAPTTPSPVRPGMGGPGTPAAPVRVINGFTTQLPGRSRRFFQRQFFAIYPRPFQAGGAGSPFPRAVTIATIQAPPRQSIVLRDISFNAYQHSGIGVDDLDEVPRGRTVGTLGFQFLKGNQGLTDFSTNLPGRGLPVLYTTAQGPNATAPRAGQGDTFQGSGPITPTRGPDPFAAYAMPGDELIAKAVVFRPPSFDLRLFEVRMSGWLAEEAELEAIIDSLSR